MIYRKWISVASMCLAVTAGLCQSAPLIYKDSTQPIALRVQDLLKRMTPEEKFWQLYMIPGGLQEGSEQYKHGIFGFQVNTSSKPGGAAAQLLNYSNKGNALQMAHEINAMQHFFLQQSRLGIPIIPFDEALHGLLRAEATVYPQAIALAATWDTLLMGRVARAIARETKSRGIRQILTPVINIASDVRWGRTEETYGEDPFLTSEMGVAFVSPFEKMGIVTTPKHFIANVGDGGRDSYPIHYNERLLQEIYLAPFKACIERGGSRSIMTAYNSYDGSPCTANNYLLNKVLKQDWGFKGFVISDASAVGGGNVLHFTAGNYAGSTADAINYGLDVIFQTSYDHHYLFKEAFDKSMIRQQAIDSAVARVLRIKFELGLFENPYVDEAAVQQYVNNPLHRAIAKQAAQESMVLLKNDHLPGQQHTVLPFPKSVRSFAVIGEDAATPRLGGYSGPGTGTVSMLDGIKTKLKHATVYYEPGCGRYAHDVTVIPATCFFHTENGELKKGLQGAYFNNADATGTPVLVRTDENINFQWTLFSPDKKINYDFFSAEWNGFIKDSVTETVKIGVQGNDGYKLYINDELVIDNWKKTSFNTVLTDYRFIRDQNYKIRLVYYEPAGNARLKLVWTSGVNNNWQDQIDKAVLAVQQADAAVVVVGIEEGEFRDRAKLGLPGHQEELIKAIAKTGKPFSVVITGGSVVTMEHWIDQTPAIVDAWYPGDEGGHAVADVLFGDYNPAGRLPITFPVFEGQLPLVYNHKPTGRGDDYDNLTGQPLFPFGYGLSYTSFQYKDLSFSKQTMGASDTTVASFTVTNTGKLAGEEVVQLYLRDQVASVTRPIKELKGFQRVGLQPGESKQLSFMITPEMLSMLNAAMQKVVEPGAFRIMIGSSSKDTRLRGLLNVK